MPKTIPSLMLTLTLLIPALVAPQQLLAQETKKRPSPKSQESRSTEQYPSLKTLFEHEEEPLLTGGFAGPLVRYAYLLRFHSAFLIGGKGNLLLFNRHGVGLEGALGRLGGSSQPGTLGSLTAYYQYYFRTDPVLIAVGGNFGYGFLSQSSNFNSYLDTGPAVEVFLRINNWFAVSVPVGYRFLLMGRDNDSYFFTGLNFSFGRFAPKQK